MRGRLIQRRVATLSAEKDLCGLHRLLKEASRVTWEKTMGRAATVTQASVNKQRAALQGLGLSSQALFGGISVGAAESYLAMSNFGLNAANATTATVGVLRGGIQEGFFNFLTGNFDNISASFENLGLKIVNVWRHVIGKVKRACGEVLAACGRPLTSLNALLISGMKCFLPCSVG